MGERPGEMGPTDADDESGATRRDGGAGARRDNGREVIAAAMLRFDAAEEVEGTRAVAADGWCGGRHGAGEAWGA